MSPPTDVTKALKSFRAQSLKSMKESSSLTNLPKEDRERIAANVRELFEARRIYEAVAEVGANESDIRGISEELTHCKR
jgi:hypothetical protein